jgi:hypothetical protein
MKVVQLKSSNVKKLTAVEVNPGDQTLITVGGKNGAGKSSVLDSIVMGLGGAALIPDEPIRTGETEAQVDLDLGDIVVTRKFKRDHLACDCGEDVGIDKGKPDLEHKPNCASFKFGPTRSSLIVRTKDGATYGSPQAMLDKLLGKIAFDPLAFSRAHVTDQEAILRKVVNLDTTAADRDYSLAYAERAKHNKSLSDAHARLKLLERHEGVPVSEVDVTALLEEIKKADELRKLATEAASFADRAGSEIAVYENSVDAVRRNIAKLRQDLVNEERTLEAAQVALGHARVRHEAAAKQLADAQAAVPDTVALNEKLRESTEINKKVRANQAHGTQAAAVEAVKGLIKLEEQRLQQAVDAKKKALAAVQYPVAGLAFTEHGLTFNGVPLKQASTAEQIRISVAIGLALNPTLRVLLVRDGSLLDDDSIKAITDQAAAADAQLWLEYMTKDKDGVTVMIEDGAVV